MFDFDSMIASHRKWTLSLLALYVLGAAFLPYPRVFNGLVLGGVISFYNLWLLQRKIKVIGDKAASGGAPRNSLGTLSRMLAAALGALIAMRYQENFHVIAVVIGIMTSYIVFLLDGLVRIIVTSRSERQ